MNKNRWLAILAVFALVVAACGGGDDNADDESTKAEDQTDSSADDGGDADEPEPADDAVAGSDGDLLLLQWQAPSQANAHLSTGTKDLLASSLVLEPLAEIGPGGELVPVLATEIPSADNGGISEDQTQMTWNLRDDIVWSDGTPFTADDVVFTSEYCSDELTGCQGNADFLEAESIVADDDYTVTITFKEPTGWPFKLFVSYTSPILQRAQFEPCVGEGATGCSDENLSPVGTGPYTVTELRPEDAVTYVMNENYRGIAEGKPAFGGVQIKGGGDAESAARSVLEIGEADYAWNLQVAPEILAPMEAAGNGVVQSAFTTNVEHINLNQTDPNGDPRSDYSDGNNPNPFFKDNPELHRALSLAINRQELVTVGYGASGIPACNMWHVAGEITDALDWCLEQDIDEANSILDGLGYDDTDGDGVRELSDGTPLEWDYVTSTNAVRQSNQELIKDYWEEIGVKANMKNESASLFFDGTGASDVSIWKFFSDIEMFTNGASAPNGAEYLSNWTTDEIPDSTNNWGGGNMPRLTNDEFDQLSAEVASLAVSDPSRAEKIKRMDEILSSEAVIPLILRANVSAFKADIEGIGDLNGWDSEYWNIEDWSRAG